MPDPRDREFLRQLYMGRLMAIHIRRAYAELVRLWDTHGQDFIEYAQIWLRRSRNLFLVAIFATSIFTLLSWMGWQSDYVIMIGAVVSTLLFVVACICAVLVVASAGALFDIYEGIFNVLPGIVKVVAQVFRREVPDLTGGDRGMDKLYKTAIIAVRGSAAAICANVVFWLLTYLFTLWYTPILHVMAALGAVGLVTFVIYRQRKMSPFTENMIVRAFAALIIVMCLASVANFWLVGGRPADQKIIEDTKSQITLSNVKRLAETVDISKIDMPDFGRYTPLVLVVAGLFVGVILSSRRSYGTVHSVGVLIIILAIAAGIYLGCNRLFAEESPVTIPYAIGNCSCNSFNYEIYVCNGNRRTLIERGLSINPGEYKNHQATLRPGQVLYLSTHNGFEARYYLDLFTSRRKADVDDRDNRYPDSEKGWKDMFKYDGKPLWGADCK